METGILHVKVGALNRGQLKDIADLIPLFTM